MPHCRECGANIDAGDMSCPECGAVGMGSTQSFQPVGGEAEEVRSTFSAVDGPALIVRKGPTPGERFYLDRPKLTVGRDPGSDIFLNDLTVSRDHAVLEILDGEVTVHDEASLNGTSVNGVTVDAAPLKDGDVLQIGTFQMVFVAGREGDR